MRPMWRHAHTTIWMEWKRSYLVRAIVKYSWNECEYDSLICCSHVVCVVFVWPVLIRPCGMTTTAVAAANIGYTNRQSKDIWSLVCSGKCSKTLWKCFLLPLCLSDNYIKTKDWEHEENWRWSTVNSKNWVRVTGVFPSPRTMGRRLWRQGTGQLNIPLVRGRSCSTCSGLPWIVIER